MDNVLGGCLASQPFIRCDTSASAPCTPTCIWPGRRPSRGFPRGAHTSCTPGGSDAGGALREPRLRRCVRRLEATSRQRGQRRLRDQRRDGSRRARRRHRPRPEGCRTGWHRRLRRHALAAWATVELTSVAQNTVALGVEARRSGPATRQFAAAQPASDDPRAAPDHPWLHSRGLRRGRRLRRSGCGRARLPVRRDSDSTSSRSSILEGDVKIRNVVVPADAPRLCDGNGTAVIIAPGGGFFMLSWGAE